MKRRDVIRLIPLSIAGIACSDSKLFAVEKPVLPQLPALPDLPDLPPPPLPPGFSGPLALRYTNKVQEMLRWIRATQSENMLEASYAVARTVMSGGQCWNNWDVGHSIGADMFPGRNGDPEIFSNGYDPQHTRKNDLLLVSIFDRPQEYYDDLVKKDIFLIGGPAPWGGDARGQEFLREEVRKFKLRPYADIWIETNVTTHGAIMNLPGMPAPIGPVSGVIGMVTYWMIIADACRILVREGRAVNIKGDEPVLSGDNVKWENLNAPLMDDYFDEVMRQIDMIGAEMGNIREIARMAADTVLAGGKVYCYSRYRESLSIEASTRRGGLALTQGTHDGDQNFRGSSKDCVIMGISKPNDEVDLSYLDKFRKAGMKVASMGPMTVQAGRWGTVKIPEGRTVPKEADIHAGRMCDTYGLFAIKGLEQKVCPTSGVLLNQIFWAACMEIAEEIIRRTGNTPGVYLSAALKGGRPHMHRMRELYNERGY